MYVSCPLGDPCLSLYTLEGQGYKESSLFGTIQYLVVHVDQCRARLRLVGWATPGAQPMWPAVGIRGRTPHIGVFQDVGRRSVPRQEDDVEDVSAKGLRSRQVRARALVLAAIVASVKGPNMARGGVNSLFKNLQIN